MHGSRQKRASLGGADEDASHIPKMVIGVVGVVPSDIAGCLRPARHVGEHDALGQGVVQHGAPDLGA